MLYVACAWEATFLAFAFADRINQLQAEKARAQKQLLITTRENEQQLRQFLDTPVGIGVLDAKGKPYFTNQRAKQLFGKGVLSHLNTEQLSQTYQLYKAGTGRLYPCGLNHF